MDERTFRVLEYDKIREMLAGFAASSLGKKRASALAPRDDADWVRARLAETSEARGVLSERGMVPLGGLTDISEFIARARIYRALAPEDLLRVAAAMRCSRLVGTFLSDEPELAPRLAEMAEGLAIHQDIEDEIDRCIDEHANVRTSASEKLQRLSARIETLERRVRERVESVLRRESERGTLQDAVVVQRSGRFCLAVQANSQSRLQGIVHDRSDSGATVFMEPFEVVEAGNDLRQTSMDMEEEVQRILRELTGMVGAAADELSENLRTLGIVDFIFAKARMAQELNATEPALRDEPQIDLRRARHPLLSDKVVPIDVWLGKDFDTLVITGPNTGGKTVTLKTVGLFALMTQSGLHIPASAGSEMPVMSYVYADIGDEQSIEQSLSTFSSHMTQIVKIINRVQAHRRNMDQRGEEGPVRALILLDELGAGTDPTEGTALARAILTELHELGCRTLATTHYNDLKVFAYSTDGIENASVEFDIKTLAPTYHLRIGSAGSSNAFDIAQRLGLSRKIVGRGRAYLGDDAQSFEEAVSEVERQRMALRDQTRETQDEQKTLAKLKNRYEDDLAKLQAQRDRATREGFDEARAIVRAAEEQARRVIADLQKQPRQSKVTQEGRDELRELSERIERERARALEPAPPVEEPEAEEKTLGEVLMGDAVHVPDLSRDGVVSDILGDGKVEVQVGNLRIEARVSDLRPPVEETRADAVSLAETMQTRKSFSVPREIDIRGTTVDEAVLELEKYIDDAVLARFPMVRVIHGKGTGALRQGVQAFLRKHKQVREFKLAEHEEGGEGATEVYF